MAAALKTITKEELRSKLQKGEPVQVINVLEPEGYHMGFIPGSRKIPYTQLEKRLKEIDKSKEVITYCASYQCTASRNAAELLSGQGYNVRAYEGGIQEWKQAGYPVE